jgi:ADP-ribose pyrophosphatase
MNGFHLSSKANVPAGMNSTDGVREVMCVGKFLRLVKEGRWEYADRVNATGGAIIVAATEEKKLLLVEQYRLPCHARTIELPAGIVGDEPGSEHEAQSEAARRELIEETGYAAETMKFLTVGPTSSGLASELVTFFLATGLRRVGSGGGQGHEDIQVHEVPLAEVRAWLEAKSRAGVLIDPKIYAGLYFLNGI